MLNYARQRAVDALKIPLKTVLATSGPAGVQAGEFPCEAAGLFLYLLIPRTSDHLFNLEQNPAVTVLAPQWELRGNAQIVFLEPAELQLAMLSASGQFKDWVEWSVLVRVEPIQLQIRRAVGWGNVETIDLKPD